MEFINLLKRFTPEKQKAKEQELLTAFDKLRELVEDDGAYASLPQLALVENTALKEIKEIIRNILQEHILDILNNSLKRNPIYLASQQGLENARKNGELYATKLAEKKNNRKQINSISAIDNNFFQIKKYRKMKIKLVRHQIAL